MPADRITADHMEETEFPESVRSHSESGNESKMVKLNYSISQCLICAA